MVHFEVGYHFQAGADLGPRPPGPWPGAQPKSPLIYMFFSAKKSSPKYILDQKCGPKDLLLAAIEPGAGSLPQSLTRTHALPIILQTCAAALPILPATRPPPSSPLALSTPSGSTDPARAQDSNLRGGWAGSDSGICHRQSGLCLRQFASSLPVTL
jgi:hypothetical protein